MKRLLLIVHVCLSVGCLSVSAQSEQEMKDGYYVVVAAYGSGQEEFAQRFTKQLRQKGFAAAAYGFNSPRHFFYVYLKYFEKYDPSIQDMLHTRSEGLFTDAWVRIVRGAIMPSGSETEITPKTVENTAVVPPLASPADKPSSEPEKQSAETPALEEVKEPKRPGQAAPVTMPVVFNLVRASNNKPVEGEVEIIDPDRSRLIEKLKGNQKVALPDPKNNSGALTLICDVFGYRKLQHELPSFEAAADNSEIFVAQSDTAYVINFELVRYEKGDIATLYNVYFYNDAAVMRPESKFELNSLLQLMNENPKYRIKLHGHSNGQYHGVIYSVGSDRDYFSLSDARKGNGSAKQLSLQRAAVIRDWLVDQGVAKDRMEVKAWGGRRPIYDKNGPNAQKNVRVEVEVLEN